MRELIVNGVRIDDTFAEAFGMTGTRLVITADTADWARRAAESMTGFATSVIGCGVEAGIESALEPAATPDGRPGVAVLLFAVSRDALAKALTARVGQCVLTCAGTACFAGIAGETGVPLGRSLRYFGDGLQRAKRISGRRYWRIPVMDGEFLCEDQAPVQDGVGGGNLLLLGRRSAAVLAAAERAVAAMRRVEGVILPFPGGIARSGSKVGSKYKALRASTNTAFAPTVRGQEASLMPPEARCAYEIVVDGLILEAVASAMRAGLEAAAGPGVVQITAGNYGGKLGPHHIRLHDLLARA
jgi:formylmethanofuran--tetrahydromethanopterin N-formyltransferase